MIREVPDGTGVGNSTVLIRFGRTCRITSSRSRLIFEAEQKILTLLNLHQTTLSSNLFVPFAPESSRVSGDNPLEMSIQRYCTSYRYSSIYLFAWLARRSFQGLGWPGIGMSGPYGVSRRLVLPTSPRISTVRGRGS
jgi:hypothetical protein